MDEYTFCLIIISSSLFFSYSTIKSYWERFLLKYRKFQTILHMTLSNDYTTESSCHLSEDGKTIKISYNRLGKTYDLYLPYSTSLSSKMNKTRVYVIRKGSTENNDEELIEEEITQQPGIKYYITADDLGAEKICVRTKGEDKKETIYRDRDPILF